MYPMIEMGPVCTCRPDTVSDVRALWLHHLTTSPAAKLVSLLHGRLFPLTDLLSASAVGEAPTQGHGKCRRCMPYGPTPGVVHSAQTSQR